MINRIRAIRKDRGLTLAELAAACTPPTTAQTIGRLETGARNLSLRWMERIGAALEIDPEALVRSEASEAAHIVATLGPAGVQALARPREAVLAVAESGAPMSVLTVEAAVGPYLPGDQIWLRRLSDDEMGQAINRDVLVPRKAGRFTFGRLIDRQGDRIGVLPPGAGQKQEIIADPAWIALAHTLVRKL